MAGASSLDFVDTILKSISDTKQIVDNVSISRANFLMMTFYLGELRPVVESLIYEDEELLNSPHLMNNLQRLAATTADLHQLTQRCTKNSRILLLYQASSLVEDLRKHIKDLAEVLLALPSSLSSKLTKSVKDLWGNLNSAVFFMEPGEQRVANAISEALAANRADERHATSLLHSIASHLMMPHSAAVELKLELQQDYETTELNQDGPNLHDLRALCELLSSATVLADVRKLAPNDFLGHGLGSASVASSFFCPITGQVMQDPVMLVEAGFTYERSAICEWFSRGHRTCPNTGEELQSLDIVPNLNLRQAIEEHCEKVFRQALANAIDNLRDIGNADIECAIETLKSLHDTDPKYRRLIAVLDGIPQLVGILKPASPRVKDMILRMLCGIAALGDEYKVWIKDSGVIPILLRWMWKDPGHNCLALQLLFELSTIEEGKAAILAEKKSTFCLATASSNTECCTEEMRYLAERVLDNLCHDNPSVVIDVASSGAVFQPLVKMLSSGKSPEIRRQMAEAVASLPVNEASYASLIKAGVIPPLLDLLQSGDLPSKVTAVKAVCALSATGNKAAVCDAGVIPTLLIFLKSNEEELRFPTIATLANLVVNSEGVAAIDLEAVSLILDLLRLHHGLVLEYSLKILQFMAKERKTVRLSIKNRLSEAAYLCTLLQDERISPNCRSSVLSILCHLAEDRESRPCVVLSRHLLFLLLRFLERTGLEDRESILGILAGIAKVKEMKQLLMTENILATVVRSLNEKSPKAQEYAASTLSKLVDPAHAPPDIQLIITRLGALPILVRLLKEGSYHAKALVAVVFFRLCKDTPLLAEKVTFVKKMILKIRGKNSMCCDVHAGRSGARRVLCLVESGAAACLADVVKEGEAHSAERALDALGTLIQSKEYAARGVKYLVNMDLLPALVNLVGKSSLLTEKVMKLLEQIYRDRRFREEKYWAGAKFVLYTTVMNGNVNARKSAAQALEHLGIYPKGSITSSD